jgi:hypothetical protein
MGGEKRIYLNWESDLKINEIEKKIQDYIAPMGYNIFDYPRGLAIKTDKCNPKKNNQIRIGKLIKDQDLLTEFKLDEYRTNSRKYNLRDCLIVISQKYNDIVNMSTGRNWTSCMNTKDGGHSGVINDDLKHGTLIAYLVNKDDLEIKHPLGRVLIKPYHFKNNPKLIYYKVDGRVYGNVPDQDKFKEIVSKWFDKNQPHTKNKGWLLLTKGLYDNDEVVFYKTEDGFLEDYDVDGYDIDGYNEMGLDREGYNRKGLDKNGLTKEGQYISVDGTLFDFKNMIYPFSDYLSPEQIMFLDRNNIKISSISMGVDREVNVSGDISISYLVDGKCPISFGIVDGDFIISSQYEGKDLFGAPHTTNGNFSIYGNIESLQRNDNKPFIVEKDFYIGNIDGIKNLLGGPVYVGRSYTIRARTLESIEGIASYIGGRLDIQYTKIKDIKPLKNTIIDSRIIKISDNKIKSLVGLPKGVIKVLDCSSNPIRSLDGVPNKIKYLSFYGRDKVKTTERFENVVEINCHNNKYYKERNIFKKIIKIIKEKII